MCRSPRRRWPADQLHRTYRLPVLEALAERVGDLRVWLSTPHGGESAVASQWGRLQVEVQRSVTIEHLSRHPDGYREWQIVHLPYDTHPRLRQARPDIVMSGELGREPCKRHSTVSFLHAAGRLGYRLGVIGEGPGPGPTPPAPGASPRADVVIVNGQSGQRYVRTLGARSRRIVTVLFPSRRYRHPGEAGEEGSSAPALCRAAHRA